MGLYWKQCYIVRSSVWFCFFFLAKYLLCLFLAGKVLSTGKKQRCPYSSEEMPNEKVRTVNKKGWNSGWISAKRRSSPSGQGMPSSWCTCAPRCMRRWDSRKTAGKGWNLSCVLILVFFIKVRLRKNNMSAICLMALKMRAWVVWKSSCTSWIWNIGHKGGVRREITACEGTSVPSVGRWT